MIATMDHFQMRKIQQEISRVMAETEEGERDQKRNANHVTLDIISNDSMS